MRASWGEFPRGLGRLRSDGRQLRSAESSSPDSAARPATGWRLATLLLLFGASLMVPALVATGLLPRRRTTHRLIAGRHDPYLGLQGLRHGSDGKRSGRGSC